MPVSSLNKFTVPLSTNGSNPSQGLLMPKLKYRFRVTFDNFGVPGTPTTELTKQVITVTRPNVSFEEIKLPVYNSVVKIAGKHTWQDVTLNLRDDVTNAVTSLVGQQLQKQFDFFEQSGAASGIDYKFLSIIYRISGKRLVLTVKRLTLLFGLKRHIPRGKVVLELIPQLLHLGTHALSDASPGFLELI